MKKTILVLSICLMATFAAFAQPGSSITIDNQTACNITFEIHGVSSTSTTCPGTPASSSGRITITAGTSYTFDNALNTPGAFTMGDLFSHVEVYEDAYAGATACGGNGANSHLVGECAAPSAGPVALHESDAANTMCFCTAASANITWNSGTTTLTIN